MDINIYDKTISTSKQESLMKAIEILKNSESINKQFVSRPNINTKTTIFKILVIAMVFIIGAIIAIVCFNYTKLLSELLISIVILFVYICITFKKFVVLSVLLYQKLAPEEIRLSCVFEPSCSEYMLMAIEKYGATKGIFVGIKRLIRCHPPNGGIDNP